jgi:hypothetical protein
MAKRIPVKLIHKGYWSTQEYKIEVPSDFTFKSLKNMITEQINIQTNDKVFYCGDPHNIASKDGLRFMQDDDKVSACGMWNIYMDTVDYKF